MSVINKKGEGAVYRHTPFERQKDVSIYTEPEHTTKPIKSGQVYNNPKGVFSVPAPRSFAGTYADSEYEVTFYDDDGSLHKGE